MVNLESVDKDDEKTDNKSVISSNKNSNESSNGHHHTNGPTPTKSIFVRLNSRNMNGEQQSVQSAPLANELSLNKASTSSGPANYRRAQNSGGNQRTLKSSKSVPRQIYASQNGLGTINKSNSISSSSSKQQQYSKLCSIL